MQVSVVSSGVAGNMGHEFWQWNPTLQDVVTTACGLQAPQQNQSTPACYLFDTNKIQKL